MFRTSIILIQYKLFYKSTPFIKHKKTENYYSYSISIQYSYNKLNIKVLHIEHETR